MKKVIKFSTTKQKEQPQQLPFETEANELIYRGTKQEIPFIKKILQSLPATSGAASCN